jgi:ribosomal protein S12 methylthiotransferase accessory factor
MVGSHVIHTDQAFRHGGGGTGPEPFDLFLASLATCAGLYVLVFCQARGIPTDQLRLVQEQISEDGKLRRIVLRVLLPPDFPEKYIDAVRAAASGCRVKKTLLDPPEVEVVAVAGAAIGAPPVAVPA